MKNKTELEEIFFPDTTAPPEGAVILQEIVDVLNVEKLPSEMSIHNWLNIWNNAGTTKSKLNTTSLHFFSDKLPTESPLAYGIFVEEDEKRISVSIKGSNGEDTERGNYFKDWSGKNSKCDFFEWKYEDENDENDENDDCIGLNHRCPWVHQGWSGKFSSFFLSSTQGSKNNVF